MAATIKDIASLAQVNKCVVSHVLRDDAYAAKVRPETRERIRRIASDLGYERNLLASSTRTGIVNTIAVVCDFTRFKDFFSMNWVLSGIMMETSANDFSIKLFPETDLERTFSSIQGNRIRKMISTSVEWDLRERTAELARKYGIELVFIYECGHGEFPSVNVDNVEMSAAAVQYLAGLGHTRIGLLCVPHAHGYQYIIDRHDGYLLGMERAGLKVAPDWIWCDDDAEAGTAKMLSLPESSRPTAFYAIADNLAVRAELSACRMGRTSPRDFSIIGVGASDIGRYALTPLSTMDENLQMYGVSAVKILLGNTNGMSFSENNVCCVHASLIVRDSTDSLPSPVRK